MYDGTLKFDSALDGSGFQKGANGMDGIVKGMTAFKILEAGFKMVVQSMDAAVSRYDTLNRFPKVLQNMGYSAEASAAATKKLSDGVQGLPTTLDEIVANAQRLTVLTGNLESATDTTLALNNAFYASGASSADASRGLTQYVQMLSKGKVDIISWRTLQETMGYALIKTAEAFGFAGESAQNDLYAALRDGKITFAEFNDKLVELNDGVGGFAEMARTSTGGIATAWTNCKTAIVRGTTSIVESIDKGLSQTKFKGIENVIVSMGKGANSALTSLASVFGFLASKIEYIIPITTALFVVWQAQKFASYAKDISGVTSAIVLNTAAEQGNTIAKIKVIALNLKAAAVRAAELIQLGLFNIALFAEGVAIKANTAATNGGIVAKIAAAVAAKAAAAAQWLWNAAMSANPIGLIIAAVAALVVGIIALVSWLGSSNETYKEGKQCIEDYEAANEELAASLDESTKNFDSNSTAAEANANTSRNMLAGMQELASKGLNRTAEETYQLQARINALNSAQQGLGLTIDKTTGELSMSEEAIQAYIASTESAAKSQALEDHMKALNDQLVEVEGQFISAAAQVDLWDEQLAAGQITQQQYNKLTGDLADEVEALGETHEAILLSLIHI